jgi:hypothetical protein
MILVALEITYLLAGDTQEFLGFQATAAAVNCPAASHPSRSDRQASAEGAKPLSQGVSIRFRFDVIGNDTTQHRTNQDRKHASAIYTRRLIDHKQAKGDTDLQCHAMQIYIYGREHIHIQHGCMEVTSTNTPSYLTTS